MNEYNVNYQQRETGNINSYFSKVFMWMFAGLLVSFGTAFAVAASPTLISIVAQSRGIFFIAVIVELGLVISLTRRIMTLSKGAAATMFLLYSFINGVTLSFIFLIYDLGTVSVAFLVAALLFAAMAIRGKVTDRDLSRVGSAVFMVLIGIIIASVVNMFLRNSMLDLAISIIGVLVFSVLTAYDMQKIKQFYYSAGGNPEMAEKLSIMGALTLYLDFINIFLYLLRIFGRRD